MQSTGSLQHLHRRPSSPSVAVHRRLVGRLDGDDDCGGGRLLSPSTQLKRSGRQGRTGWRKAGRRSGSQTYIFDDGHAARRAGAATGWTLDRKRTGLPADATVQESDGPTNGWSVGRVGRRVLRGSLTFGRSALEGVITHHQFEFGRPARAALTHQSLDISSLRRVSSPVKY
jgi:hypothetical protein